MTDDLRYPVGPFTFNPNVTATMRQDCIRQIRETPAALRAAIRGLSEKQMDTPYRPGGWTVRQVVHHVPESHMNAFVRFKLALTEDNPTIKPYKEDAWAKLPDISKVPPETSVRLLEALHERWIALLETMKPEDFTRPLIHPESGQQPLDRMLQMYAWHGRHHVGHITALRKREGW